MNVLDYDTQNREKTKSCLIQHAQDPDQGCAYDTDCLPVFRSLRKYPTILTDHIANEDGTAYCYRGQDIILEAISKLPFTVSIGHIHVFKSVPTNQLNKVSFFNGGGIPLILFTYMRITFHGIHNQQFRVLGEVIVNGDRHFYPSPNSTHLELCDWIFKHDTQTYQFTRNGALSLTLTN